MKNNLPNVIWMLPEYLGENSDFLEKMHTYEIPFVPKEKLEIAVKALKYCTRASERYYGEPGEYKDFVLSRIDVAEFAEVALKELGE